MIDRPRRARLGGGAGARILRKTGKRVALVWLATTLCLLGGRSVRAGVWSWNFEGDLLPESGSGNVLARAYAPAASPALSYEPVMIGGVEATALGFSRGTALEIRYSAAANGGGRVLNQYTLLLDVLFPSRGPSGGWAALLQTNRENTDDGDWFISPAAGLGISGQYGGSVPDGVWHRLGLVVDLSAGTLRSFVDGSEVQMLSGLDVDGRFALALDSFLLFADENEENAAGLLASLQFRDRALGAPEMASLAGPDAAGIPFDDAPPPPPAGGLRGQWLFSSETVANGTVADLAGDRPGVIQGPVALGASPSALLFDGATNFVRLGGAAETGRLPAGELTAAAWVSIDEGTRWGGILGYIQDNGDFERGWLLGYTNSTFSWAVSASGRLTYLSGETEFDPGVWYHVVGTYDGATMRLYVNGQLEATSNTQQGGIDYAASNFVIGAYHDDNEFFPLAGAVHEAGFYDEVLGSDAVQALYESGRETFPAPTQVTLGPFVRFVGRDEALVTWESDEDTLGAVLYGPTRATSVRADDMVMARSHEVLLAGLELNTPYYFRIEQEVGGSVRTTTTFEFSTEFNYVLADSIGVESPFPADALTPIYAAAAEHILEATGITKGYCLDYASGDGRLAFELATRSELQVIAVEEDGVAVERARRKLRAAGLYGNRITVHRRSLGALPYAGNVFNLVVSGRAIAEGELSGTAAAALAVTRPDGGTLFLGQPNGATAVLTQAQLDDWFGSADLDADVTSGASGLWARHVRPPLEGAGSWTHMYGDPSQSANSGDEIVHGRDLRVQWFGRPGPRGMIDRQSRNQAPLIAAGRLFVEGDDRIFAQDAYNGRILWTLELPGVRRVNMPRDTGNLCADRESLFVAVEDSCWRVGGDSGELEQVYAVDGGAGDERARWGYLAVVDERLYGSRVEGDARYREFKGPDKWFDTTAGGYGTAMVTSDVLFCLDRDSGDPLWRYERGLVVNPSISIGGGRVYFVEGRDAALLAAAERRLGTAALWSDLHLVALDAESGAHLWERPTSFPASPVPLAFSLVYADERLVASVSTSRYDVFAFSAVDGASLWHRAHAWNRSHHGGHMYHPVIAAGAVFLEPRVYDLSSGDIVASALPVRGGCSTLSAAADMLHFVDWDYHNGSFFFWDLDSDQRIERAGSRASCWLSIVSGGGMVISPTASAGCTCRYPLQGSIGYGSW